MDLVTIKRKESFFIKQSEFYAQMKEEKLLTDHEFTMLNLRLDSEVDQLRDSKKKHNEWANHDTVVTFQHKEDNYLADKMGKIAWPSVEWDSENGQGFAYCSATEVFYVMEWLNKNNCSMVAHRAK